MWHILSIFYQNPHIQYIYIYICSIYIYICVKYYIYCIYSIYILHIIYVCIYTTHTLYFTYSISILIIDTYGLAGCWENPPSPATGGGGNHLAGGEGGCGGPCSYIYIYIYHRHANFTTPKWGFCQDNNTEVSCKFFEKAEALTDPANLSRPEQSQVGEALDAGNSTLNQWIRWFVVHMVQRPGRQMKSEAYESWVSPGLESGASLVWDEDRGCKLRNRLPPGFFWTGDVQQHGMLLQELWEATWRNGSVTELYNSRPAAGGPPRGLSCHQLFSVCLGFVYHVYVGFVWGLSGFHLYSIFSSIFSFLFLPLF